MNWEVAEVNTELPLSLRVRFVDGTVGKVRIEPSFLTGVFQVLQDERLFQQAYVESGAVAWPGNLDLAPDMMYQAIKAHGECVLR